MDAFQFYTDKKEPVGLGKEVEMMGKIWCVFFSPSGTTEKVMERIATNLSGSYDSGVKVWDLLRTPEGRPGVMRPDDVLVIGIPVFSGRVPTPCLTQIKSLQGSHTPAIAVAVYGNRDYDDALLELQDLLEQQGFCTIGAAAFVAQHSIFTKVAAGRPDAADFEKIDQFSALCAERLKARQDTWKPIQIKGNRPYREILSVPIKPSANTRCTTCGVCVRICPVHAIDSANPRKTDRSLCISCTACMTACPQNARSFPHLMLSVASKGFEKKCAQRREPEWFL